MKKAFKVLLLAVLILAIGSFAFANGSSEKAAPAEAERSSKPVTLTLWNSSQTMVDWYNETVIPEFQKMYPEVQKVDILYMPIQDFVKKLAVALPSGDVPDVMEIEDSWATPYVTAGYFDENTAALNEIVNSMNPAFKGCLTYDGKMWGVPVAPFFELMFYNTDMMKEAGIESIPKTYDELIEDAVKMTKRNADGSIAVSGFSMRLGGNPSGTTQKWWVLALLANGVDLYEESTTQPGKYHCGFNNEGGYNALKLYIDMLYKYKVDDFASQKDTSAFSAGKTAINMREPSSSVSIQKNGPDINWVAAPMPAGPKAHATFLITLNLYVPRDGKNKFYAQEFVKLATSREMQNDQISKRGGVSPYTDTDYVALGLDERLLPAYDFTGITMKTVPVQNAYDTIQVKLGEMLPDIFAKSELLDNPEGIKAEIAALAKVVDDIYKDYDEYGE
ncbi:MAG: ABC transporter substrate-binding protein [Sphaerochaetaceae bacterium]